MVKTVCERERHVARIATELELAAPFGFDVARDGGAARSLLDVRAADPRRAEAGALPAWHILPVIDASVMRADRTRRRRREDRRERSAAGDEKCSAPSMTEASKREKWLPNAPI
ncbi:MAG TPA: hypothetical protein VN707_03940 [Casimicrobiaceae bacterium]|nr:hypothetical protein [Casimicrobiaceae bacterium]